MSIIAVIAQIVPVLTIYLIVRELILHINDLQSIDTAYVWNLSWLTLAAISTFGIITYIANMLSHIAAFNILYEIRVSLAAKLARLPMGYFTSRANGSIKKILHEDVERIELFVAHHIIDITQAVALPVIAITTLFFFDWRLGFGVLIPLPLAFAAQLTMFKGKGEDLFKQWQQRLGAMNGTIVEYVRCICRSIRRR